MKRILLTITILCFILGVGYFAVIDLDKTLRHWRIVNEIAKQTQNSIELLID